MHIDSGWEAEAEKPVPEEEQGGDAAGGTGVRKAGKSSWKEDNHRFAAQEKELQEIFERTFRTSGKEDEKKPGWKRPGAGKRAGTSGGSGMDGRVRTSAAGKKPEKEYLLVDGYNIIFAWEELKLLAEVNIDSARDRLMDILSNYQGYRPCTLILVFDAYKVSGGQGEVMKYHNIYVVYTKEAETADQYIEKTVHRMNRKYQVTVATSDALEQVIILGQGAQRLSAQGLKDEVEQTGREIRQILDERRENDRNYLLNALPEDMVDLVEDIRLGKKQFK